MRPVRVTSESATGLTLLKVVAKDLVPARLADQAIADDDAVFVAGYDASSSLVGRLAGHLQAIGPLRGVGTLIPSLIETDIPLAGSIGGGPLSDSDGTMVRLVVVPRDRNGERTARALSERYLIDWFDRWRDSIQQFTGDSADWPAFAVPV